MTPIKGLPRDKFDVEAVRILREQLPNIDATEVPQLLEWTADCSWPVARPLAGVLFQAPEKIAPHVLAILRRDDAAWKWNLITLIVTTATRAAARTFRPELARLATSEAPADLQEDVPALAAEAIAWIDSDLRESAEVT
jgi:hypothetical protein